MYIYSFSLNLFSIMCVLHLLHFFSLRTLRLSQCLHILTRKRVYITIVKSSLSNRKREKGPRANTQERKKMVPLFFVSIVGAAASRRRFRRFALVRHNCFRPSSRLRQHDIVSFRYFRFQAHRSMSAPLLPRSGSPSVTTAAAVLVFLASRSSSERRAVLLDADAAPRGDRRLVAF